MTTAPFTVLAQDAASVLRLLQADGVTVLQCFSDRGCEEIRLDAPQLAALLRALPRAVVRAALGLHENCEDCGCCLICVGCQCAADAARDAALTLDLDPAATHPSHGLWTRQPGTVCACAAHAGVHVADAACGAGQEETR